MRFFTITIASIVSFMAEIGAGLPSGGFGYEPKMPKSLMK